MIHNTEDSIIQSLLTNQEYFGRVFSHLKPLHFSKIENQEIFKLISGYYNDYQEHPKPKEIGLKIKEIKSSEKLRDTVVTHFKDIMKDHRITNVQFMVEETEKHVQYEEFKHAILKGAEAIQTSGDLEPVYNMMGEALSINFDTYHGLEFSNTADRLNFYRTKLRGKSFGVQCIDDAMGSGFYDGTLVLVGAPSFGGKSIALTHFASVSTLAGKNGIHFSLELSEFDTCRRIDANVLDIAMDELGTISDEDFNRKYQTVKDSLGRLIIKEYGAGELNTLKIQSMLNDLYIEENFKPDYITIDYLTLMSSSRVKSMAGLNTYSYYKLVAEEVHSLAKKLNIPIFSAVQLGRQAYGKSEGSMADVADSIGIMQTASVVFFLHKSPELDAQGNMMVNFVKNRNTGKLASMLVGIDYQKMRFYDVSVNNCFTVNNEQPKGTSVDFEMDSMFGGF